MKFSQDFYRALAVVFILALMACIIPPPLAVLWYLMVGWIFYLARVLPQVQVNYAGVGSAVISLLGVLWLGHVMARWLWGQTRRASDVAAQPWKFRWTLAGAAVVVLMFVCGIAMIGATHQTAWLARSDSPIFQNRMSELAKRVQCGANMHAIGNAISLYASEHGGALPDTIEELVLTQDINGYSFVCPSSGAEPLRVKSPQALFEQLRGDSKHNTYVYYGRGLKLPLPETQIILSEPLQNHDGAGVNVLYLNSHVEWKTPAEAAGALSQIGAAR